MNNEKFKEMTPEIFKTLSKEEKLDYYTSEVIPKIKWGFDDTGDLVALNLEYFRNIEFALSNNLSLALTELHRIKPEPQYIHFTYKDRHLFMGKEIKYKDTDKWGGIVSGFNDLFVFAYCRQWKYYDAFKYFVFADGSPFGKKVV